MEDIEQPRLRQLADWFEPAAKLLSAVLIVVYLTGFLVVCWYLSRFGVSSLSLLQLNYLVAGLWVVLPPICIQLVNFGRDSFVEHLESDKKRIHWTLKFLVNLLTSFPSTFVMAGFFISFLVVVLSWYKLILAFFLVACTGLRSSLFIASVISRPEENKRLVSRKLASSYGGLSLALYILYVWFFAQNIYPAIPFEWGGGRPISVEFLDGDKPLPDCLVRDGISKHSVAYKLLAMTDKSYVVLPSEKGQKSIQFNHEAVNGIVVLSDK